MEQKLPPCLSSLVFLTVAERHRFLSTISTIHHHHNYPGQIFPFLRFCPKPDIYRCPCEMYLSLLIHLSHQPPYPHPLLPTSQWPAWIRSGFPSASRGAPWSRVRRWSPNSHTPRLPWSLNFFRLNGRHGVSFLQNFDVYSVFQKSSNLNVKTKLKHLKKTVKWNPTNMLLFFTLNPIKTAAIHFGLWDLGDLWDP